MSLDIVYYSNRSGNTKRFVEKLGYENIFSVSQLPLASKEYVLFVPTYGGGNGEYSIPRPVAKFLNVKSNRDLLRGVVGFGNTNFGDHYCKAAYMITNKTGTPEDVELVKQRMRELDEQLQLS